MNALYMVVLCLIQSAALTVCCSKEKINMTVDNASILCTTDVSCVAECYRGFIFSSSQTKQSYSCLNGVWSPVLSTCKRIPVISVTYLVIWKIDNVVPTNCVNVSIRLKSTAEMLEESFTSVCSLLLINSTAKFTYSVNCSLVNGQLIAEYSNFTSMFVVETCIAFVIDSVTVKKMLRDMFKDIFCNDLSLIYEVKNPHSVDKRNEYCYNGTQVHFVKAVGKNYNELYCDFAVTETTTPMTSPKLSSKSIIKKTTLSETDLGLPDTDDLYTYETNTHDMKLSNDGLNKESKIYIATAGGGFFLITIIIVFAVCRGKRYKSSSKTKDITYIANFVKNEGLNIPFKGELIENELYQSADNMVDKNNIYSHPIEHGSM